MHKVLAIARRDYKVNFRRGGFQFWTWLLPVLGGLTLLAASIFSGQVTDFFERQLGPGAPVERVGLVDESGHFTPLLPEYDGWMVPYSDGDEAGEALATEAVDAVMYIPEDYLITGLIRVDDPDAKFGITRISNEQIRLFVTEHLVAGRDLDPTLEARLLQPFSLVALGDEGAAGPGPGDADWVVDFTPFAIGILFMLAIFTGSGYMLGGVTEEKNSRIIEVLVSSVTPQQLLMGKILGLGALSLTQLAVWVTSLFVLGQMAPVVIEAAPDVSGIFTDQLSVWVLGGVYFLLGVLVYNVLFASIGAVTSSVEESQMAGGVASLIAVIPFIFGGYTFMNPHETYSQVLSYFPLTAPTMMLIRIGTPDLPTVDLVGTIVVLCIAAAGLFWLGGRLFAHGLLMYDRRPSLADLLRS